MKNGITKLIFLLAAVLSANVLAAQTSTGGSSFLLGGIIITAILLVLGVIVMVGDNLIGIEAKQSGVKTDKVNLSVFPNLSEILAPKLPGYVQDAPVKVLKRGFTINLLGEAEKNVISPNVSRYALVPPNFRGIAPIPKLVAEIGSNVKAGDKIFFDKANPDVFYVAPVSGELVSLNRGAKRSIAELVILADKEIQYKTFNAPDLNVATRDDLVAFMKESGAFQLIRQRPYDVIADTTVVPRDIFISTFDTAPLAPDQDFVVKGREAAFQKGLDVLNRLTSGKVHLGLNAGGKTAPSSAFTEATGVEKTWFHGEHPAGNVGVQIHHVAPIGASDIVWTLGVQDVITLGTLFAEGKWDVSRIIALTGNEVEGPTYISTYAGANIGDLTAGRVADQGVRIISGDVLSGSAKGKENYLDFHDDQITVITEGDYYEPFGWLLPQKSRPSLSKTYPNFLFSDTKYKADTNTHGERRAFVVTGQYEAVLPMDVYPQALMKSIIVNDFEKMEGLGIYELIEEDIAICEFVCTSKQPLQKILREGLDTMHEQG
ncbi:MAG: Na(+)-translocating NADH-quinone reductase subunit A [Saprospiraceae bacterium]